MDMTSDQPKPQLEPASRAVGQTYAGKPWYQWAIELSSPFAIVVAFASWCMEADDRTRERHYRAWELINSARATPLEGKREAGWSGDGGRKGALQDLHQHGISLAGVLLRGAHLPGVDLRGADLRAADFAGANLWGAKLQGAKLHVANLAGASLRGAILQDAELFGAELQDSNLAEANLQRARLNSDPPGNVESAYQHPDWRLKGANLRGANLAGADLRGANLQDVEGLTREQLLVAIIDDQTALPDYIILPEGRLEEPGGNAPR